MNHIIFENLKVDIDLHNSFSQSRTTDDAIQTPAVNNSNGVTPQYTKSYATDELYYIKCTTRENPAISWSSIHKFSKFVELNRTISNFKEKYLITSEFPKVFRKTSLGMKLNEKEIEERKNALTLWLREVIANYDIYSNELRDYLIEFINTPAHYQITYVSATSIDNHEVFAQKGLDVRIDSGRIKSESINRSRFHHQDSEPMKRTTHKYQHLQLIPLSPIFINLKNILSQIIVWLQNKKHRTFTSVLSISRSERIIYSKPLSFAGLLLQDFQSYDTFVYAILLFCISMTATFEDMIDFTFSLKIWWVSLLFGCILWYKHEEKLYLYNQFVLNHSTISTAHGSLKWKVMSIQNSLKSFVNSVDVIYDQNLLFPLPSHDHTDRTPTRNGHRLSVPTQSVIKDEKVSTTTTAIVEPPERIHVVELSTKSETKPESSSPQKINPSPHAVPKLDTEQDIAAKKMEMRRIFDEFEFPDISPTARQMYLDRRFTHNFQVRGATYMEDQKKVHPGPAMCKVMLMELYEVDTLKDGDRHDHIVTRGLAKSRMEKIASLPGNPFQYIVNFQIPGDPPVSIVVYFALPPDLLERMEGPETEKFLASFGHLINIPATEEERLAAWGIASNSSTLDKLSALGPEYKAHLEDQKRMESNPNNDGKNPTDVKHSDGSETKSDQKKSNSWMKMPTDITWPDPHEPGVLPPHDFRNSRLKLIPLVTEGVWIVKATVPSKPAILGRKVVQRYFRGPGYMEVDIYVGSSIIATQIVSVCRGYAKSFASDVAIVIQGEDSSELPEKVLGCCCINRVDLENRRKLD